MMWPPPAARMCGIASRIKRKGARRLMPIIASHAASFVFSIVPVAIILPSRAIGRIVTAETKAEMKRVLDDIQSGKFARDWMLENKVNQTSFKATRAKLAQHPIEEVGAKLRDMMPWIKKGALVDKSKN